MRAFLAVSLVVASLVLDGCGGCSDDGKGNRLPDAPVIPDMPPDMMVQSQPVTLTITDLGQPVPDVTVHFVNADDSLVKSATTDATGTASAVIAAGGSVTAIDPFAPRAVAPTPAGGIRIPELRTFLGVKPGDHLLLTRTADPISLQIDVGPVETATTYDVFTTCGGGSLSPGGGTGSGTPGGMVSLDNCHGGADVAIVARLHGEGDVLLGGLYHPDATLVANQRLDLTADPYMDLTDLTFTFVSDLDTNFDVRHAPIAKHGAIGPFSVAMNGNTGAIQEPTMTGVTKAVVDLSLSLNSRHEVIDWGAYATDYTLDLTNLLLSDITAVSAFDLATSALSWTEDSTGATPDLTVASVLFQRSEPVGRTWQWELAAPHPTTTEIKLPRLPIDGFDWNPTTGDSASQETVAGARLAGGYDAVRARIFDLVDRGNFTDFVAGASGRVVTVQAFRALAERSPGR